MMSAELLLILIGFSPIILGLLYYGVCLLIAYFAEWKRHKEQVAKGIYGTLPDWVGQMNKIYESPLDWESDNKMTEPYECPHCGAQNQTKVICEYCQSRNEQVLEKNSNNQSGDSGSLNIMSLNW